jgi:hypothetical protein
LPDRRVARENDLLVLYSENQDAAGTVLVAFLNRLNVVDVSRGNDCQRAPLSVFRIYRPRRIVTLQSKKLVAANDFVPNLLLDPSQEPRLFELPVLQKTNPADSALVGVQNV